MRGRRCSGVAMGGREISSGPLAAPTPPQQRTDRTVGLRAGRGRPAGRDRSRGRSRAAACPRTRVLAPWPGPAFPLSYGREGRGDELRLSRGAQGQARCDHRQDQARIRRQGGRAVHGRTRPTARARASSTGASFVLEDVYVHYVETAEDFEGRGRPGARAPLFAGRSAGLDAYITPYNPRDVVLAEDATAREFYTWDAESDPISGDGERPGGRGGAREARRRRLHPGAETASRRPHRAPEDAALARRGARPAPPRPRRRGGVASSGRRAADAEDGEAPGATWVRRCPRRPAGGGRRRAMAGGSSWRSDDVTALGVDLGHVELGVRPTGRGDRVLPPGGRPGADNS